MKKVEIVCVKKTTVDPPDGGWGWVVVGASFINFFISIGIVRSYGIFYLFLKNDFPDNSATDISWIPALMSTVILFGGLISGFLCKKFGERVTDFIGAVLISTGLIASFFANGILYLCISIGMMFGVGSSICTTCGIFMTAKYFKKKRAFANGIVMAGSSVGNFVFPPIVEKLCEHYGFRETMLLMGGAALNLCAMAYFFRPLPSAKCTEMTDISTWSKFEENCHTNGESVKEINQNLLNSQSQQNKGPSDENKTSPLQFFTDKIFIAITISGMFYKLVIPYVLFFVPDHATSRGIGKADSAYLLSANAVCDMVGRAGFGWVSDRDWIPRVRVYSLGCFLAATGLLALPFSYSYSSLMVCMIAFGLGAGSSITLLNVILSDEYGADKLATTLGIVMAFQAFTAFFSSPIAGLIRDLYGQYSGAFILFGLSLIISGCVMELVTVVKAVRKRKENQTRAIGLIAGCTNDC